MVESVKDQQVQQPAQKPAFKIPSDDGWTEAEAVSTRWEPKPNDVIAGTVATKRLDGRFGAELKILTKSGAVVTLPSHRQLQATLEAHWGHLIPGQTLIKVQYLGEDPEADSSVQNATRNYKLKYKNPEE
jgi:hypothetical protein